MRGKLRLMGLAATIALLTTACLSSGGGGGGGGGTADAGTAEGTVRYVLWDANQLPGYKKCAAAFTAKNPKIQIKIEQKGWDDYWGGLTTSFVAGNAPEEELRRSDRVVCPGRDAAHLCRFAEPGPTVVCQVGWTPDQQRTACALRSIRATSQNERPGAIPAFFFRQCERSDAIHLTA